MLEYLRQGETVVTAVSHRDFILIFGSYGTVIMAKWSEMDGFMVYQRA